MSMQSLTAQKAHRPTSSSSLQANPGICLVRRILQMIRVKAWPAQTTLQEIKAMTLRVFVSQDPRSHSRAAAHGAGDCHRE